MTKRQKEQFFLRLGVSGKISAAAIVVLAVIAGLSYFAYMQWIEPRLEVASFEDSLAEFGARKFQIPHNYSAVLGSGVQRFWAKTIRLECYRPRLFRPCPHEILSA